jgi:hypothetical protein
MCRLSRNSGASASRNHKGPCRTVAGKLYLYLTPITILKGCKTCFVALKKVKIKGV